MTTPYVDPFDAPEKHPAVSWKNVPFGTTVHYTIRTLPKNVQGRDYDTGEPAVWDNGDPKMVTVMELETAAGEIRSLWCNKGTAMFAALVDAQKAAGARFEIGGRLSITITGEVQNPAKPKLNPAKQFSAVYASNDPFSDAPEWAKPEAVGPPSDQVMASQTWQPPTNGAAQAAPQQQAAAPGVDPAVMAALANLSPDLLAAMAAKAQQAT